MAETAIIISTFNRRMFLETTLRSVLQTKGDYKVFVYDDGSTDGTKETMKNFPDVEYFRFEINNGLRYILDYAIRHVSDKGYKYISYNQDDVIFPDPNWLRMCIYYWESTKTPKVGFVTCHEAPEHPTEKVVDEGRVLIKPSCRATHLFASTERWLRFGRIPILTPGIAAPKMGQGSKVDWWLMGHELYKESEHSLMKEGEKVAVIPQKCIHIADKPWHSTWANPNQEKWVIKNGKS